MEPTDWIDVTTLGDNYQVEMTVDGKKYRHRRWSIGAEPSYRGGSAGMQRAWIDGRPPSGYHAVGYARPDLTEEQEEERNK